MRQSRQHGGFKIEIYKWNKYKHQVVDSILIEIDLYMQNNFLWMLFLISEFSFFKFCFMWWPHFLLPLLLAWAVNKSIIHLLAPCRPPILSTSNRIPTSKKGSHVYTQLQVFWVILLFDINVVLMLQWWPDVTIVQPDVTIIVPWQLST